MSLTRVTSVRRGLAAHHWTPYEIGLTAILVVTVSLRAYTASSWSWFQDDFRFISKVPGTGMAEYVLQDADGHVYPGELFLVWVVTTLDPLDYTWAALVTCVLAGAIVVGWGLALREIFGERLHLLAAVVILALTPGSTIVSLWWFSVLYTYSQLAAMGFTLWFLARYLLRGHRVGDFVGLNLSFAWGLVMLEKSLLITVPLFFLCLLLTPGRLRDGLRAATRALWPIAVMSVVYVGLYAYSVRGSSVGESPDTYARTAQNAARLVADGMANTVLPTLVGGPFTTSSSAASALPRASTGLALLLWAAMVILAIVALIHRRRAGLALLMPVTYAAIAWALVFGSDRFSAYGPSILEIPRYSADIIPVALLACLFLVTPTRGETGPLRRPVSPSTLLTVRRALVVYLVGVSIAGTVSTGRTWDALEPGSPKPWVDALIADARELGAVDVFDTAPPGDLVNPFLLTTVSRVSAVLHPLDLPLRFNQPTERYVVANADGHFRKAAVVGGVENAGPGPDGECGYAVDVGEVTDIPLTGDLFDLTWGMQITYFTGTDARIAVLTDHDRVEVDIPVNDTGQLGTRQLVISDEVTDLSIEGISGDASVCISEVRIGSVEATDEVPEQLTD